MNNQISVLDIPETVKGHRSIIAQNTGLQARKALHCYEKDFAILRDAQVIKSCGPAKTDHYNLTLCMNGSCKKTIGHFVFEVYPSSIHFISPGHVQYHENASDDLHLYQILFKKEFLTGSFLKENILDNLVSVNADFAPIYGIATGRLHTIEAIYDRISEEMSHSGIFHLQIIKLLVIELLYEMNRICEKCLLASNRHLNRQYQLVTKYKQLIDERYTDLKTVQEYADLLYVSAKYLTQIVKSETGENALHLIHKRQYREAQYLLSSSSLSIKEIAEKLNFDNNSHFSRFFKRHCGSNPSIYKSLKF